LAGYEPGNGQGCAVDLKAAHTILVRIEALLETLMADTLAASIASSTGLCDILTQSFQVRNKADICKFVVERLVAYLEHLVQFQAWVASMLTNHDVPDYLVFLTATN
jgi:hypothetical protein